MVESVLDIEKKEKGIRIIIADNYCNILVDSYGEVCSCNFNRTEIKRIIKHLNKFLKEGVN